MRGQLGSSLLLLCHGIGHPVLNPSKVVLNTSWKLLIKAPDELRTSLSSLSTEDIGQFCLLNGEQGGLHVKGELTL